MMMSWSYLEKRDDLKGISGTTLRSVVFMRGRSCCNLVHPFYSVPCLPIPSRLPSSSPSPMTCRSLITSPRTTDWIGLDWRGRSEIRTQKKHLPPHRSNSRSTTALLVDIGITEPKYHILYVVLVLGHGHSMAS